MRKQTQKSAVNVLYRLYSPIYTTDTVSKLTTKTQWEKLLAQQQATHQCYYRSTDGKTIRVHEFPLGVLVSGKKSTYQSLKNKENVLRIFVGPRHFHRGASTCTLGAHYAHYAHLKLE